MTRNMVLYFKIKLKYFYTKTFLNNTLDLRVWEICVRAIGTGSEEGNIFLLRNMGDENAQIYKRA